MNGGLSHSAKAQSAQQEGSATASVWLSVAPRSLFLSDAQVASLRCPILRAGVCRLTKLFCLGNRIAINKMHLERSAVN